jgi:hypothetical protein
MHPTAENRQDLAAQLDHWVAAGLISAEQAAGIARWEQLAGAALTGPDRLPATGRTEGATPRRSVAVEALAYLGGAVILAALVVATVGYWSELTRAARIAIPLSATVVLLLAGVAARPRFGAASSRVRGVLWLLCSATLAVLLVVLTDVPSTTGSAALLEVAAGLTMGTWALWLAHRAVPQQMAAFAAVQVLAVAVANAAAEPGGVLDGAAMAAVALAWGISAWYGLLPGVDGRPASVGDAARRAGRPIGADQRRVGLLLAAVGTCVGAVVLAVQQGTAWLGVLPVVLVVVAAVMTADLVMVGIGAAGTLIVLPIVVHAYVESLLSMALVLLAAGAALVAVALWVARHRRTR